MQRQAEKAMKVAVAIKRTFKIKKVLFPGLLTASDGPIYGVYKNSDGPGSMISFYLKKFS